MLQNDCTYPECEVGILHIALAEKMKLRIRQSLKLTLLSLSRRNIFQNHSRKHECSGLLLLFRVGAPAI